MANKKPFGGTAQLVRGTAYIGSGKPVGHGMHVQPDKHPFEISGTSMGRTPMPKRAHMTGIGPNPGGEGDKISANPSRKPVPGSINGPGIAK